MAGISDIFFYFVYILEFSLVQAVTFQHSCSGDLAPFSHEPSSQPISHKSELFPLGTIYASLCQKQLDSSKNTPEQFA